MTQKSSTKLLAALLCCVLGLTGWVQAEPQSNAQARTRNSSRVTIAFHGLRDRSGYLRVSLYDRPEGFPNGVPVARQDISLQALDSQTPLGSLTLTFSGLQPGTYAVCAFHDRNGSGKLTQNFLGIPTEEWGMSGNPHPQFRAPRFDEAKTDLSKQEDKRLLITLHT